MAESLRARLLAWYVAVLMLVITMVGAAVCWVTWRSRLAAIDAALLSRAEVVARSVQQGVGGAFDVELPPETTTYFQDPDARPYYAVWSAGGGLVDRSDPDLPSIGPSESGGRTRGNNRELIVSTRGFTILIGRNIGDVWRELWSLASTIAMVALVGVLASMAGAWWLAGRALAPVQRINAAARRMAGGDLEARIAVEHTDGELDQVASALNLAFDRLRESIERQRRFTADASHELRTPVATMMAEIDWALLRDRSAAEYRDSLETCHRSGARMQSLVEGLLTLARADSGELPINRVPIRIDDLLDESAELFRPLALQRRVTLGVSAAPDTVIGDPDRLRDLFSNLLFNGIAYNRVGGLVELAAERDGPDVIVRVRDTGIGIGPEDLPRIFDRFYRADAARTREPAGAGLGLALAKWIAEAHGGSLACSSQLNRYAEFVVRLPAAVGQSLTTDTRASEKNETRITRISRIGAGRAALRAVGSGESPKPQADL
jgi:heavy metal sensor kinase